MYREIPTYDYVSGEWSYTSFETQTDLVEYLEKIFKEPGKYEFDECSLLFNAEGRKFNKHKVYCLAPERSKDFINYWETEKEKCRKGVIYKNKDKSWYLPRDYYMWINFLPIYNKEVKKFTFADVRDAQYHMALYEELAQLKNKHAAILKKRQIASSYYHSGKIINLFYFEEGSVSKMAGSLKDYINEKGTWRFLEEYRNFLNKHTAWYRPCNPDKVLNWEQKTETTQGGRKVDIGLKSVIMGVVLEKDPTNGVGGPCTLFFHEEAGIAPKMNITLEYLLPAMQSGMVFTGMFVVAGSVGDLDQCEPLKELILNPDSKDILAVDTDLLDDKGTRGLCGLFIPEQWSMLPCIDTYGNSDVEKSLEMILLERIEWKKKLKPEDYRLRISQKPINIKEAFDYRKDARFPEHLVSQQIKRIEEKEYPMEFVDLIWEDDKIVQKFTRKLPIMEFPISPKTENKEGVIVIYEKPIENPKFGTYYASIDPVSEGKAEHVDNMLYTPEGRKRIGDIQIGDQVIGSNGQAVNVIGVYTQGFKKMCKITFSDGHSIKVCEDHLWNVKLNGGTKGYITLSVKDLLDTTKTITYTGKGRNIKKEYTISTYYKDNQNKNKWSIPIVKPINFNLGAILPINSYLLGLLLGDGGLSQKSIRFSTVDTELINSIEHILEDDLLIKKVKNSNCDYSIITKVGSRNSLTKRLKKLNLKGKRSEDKFIPQEYMYAIASSRLSLLQGLMDTDGSYSNHGAEFYSSSKKLAYQVVELVQSLGGIAKIRCKKTTHLDSYIVRILLPEYLNPFILKRKRDIYRPSKVFSRYITNIEYIDDAEAICISVDAPDNLYVTEHALVTHNTTTSESLCSIFVYKTAQEVTVHKKDGSIESHIEGDKIVASWCGRFDDLKKTHERLKLIIEYYNAWTLVENNVHLFIQYMISERKQKYLVPKNQIMFLKELGSNNNVYQEYGWKNTGVLFKSNLVSYAIQFLEEEMNVATKADGTITRVTYGVERIPDIMLLKEMQAYRDGLNVDRLVAFCALVAFAKVQESNRGFAKRIDHENPDSLQNSNKNTNLFMSPFRHMGNSVNSPESAMMRKPRNPFKNMK